MPGWDEAADLAKPPAEIPDPALCPVPGSLRATIEDLMSRYPDRHSAAIPALRAAQDHHGWCSPEAIDQVACVMRVTPGYLIAVATFYDMLDTSPVGQTRVYVCTNISCSLRGADKVLARMKSLTDGDEHFNVRGFECLGACDIAPMASVNGVYVGPLELADCQAIVDDVHADRPVLPDKQLINRPLSEDLPFGDGIGIRDEESA